MIDVQMSEVFIYIRVRYCSCFVSQHIYKHDKNKELIESIGIGYFYNNFGALIHCIIVTTKIEDKIYYKLYEINSTIYDNLFKNILLYKNYINENKLIKTIEYDIEEIKLKIKKRYERHTR